MSSTPFFSIIIPTYNRAHLISKAIKSVVAQTFTDWELLIIDDGSKDNTKEVVESFQDQRIKYIYQENQERSAARNNGINLARGKYICFLDSDDYYLLERLQSVHDELTKRSMPIEMFYTPLIVEQNGTLTKREEPESGDNSVFDHLALSIIHSQQVCVAKEILQEFQFDKRFHISEDTELWLRIARKYKVTLLKDNYSIAVVDHDARTVNDRRNNSYMGQLQTLNHIFSREHSHDVISSYIRRRLFANCYFGFAKFQIYQRNRWGASLNVLRSILTDPSSFQLKFRINVLLKLLTFSSFETLDKLISY